MEEDYENDDNTFCSDINETLKNLEYCIDNGIWQTALIDEKGDIYNEIIKWRYSQDSHGKVVWRVDDKQLYPIVWFGSKNGENDDYWTVRAHKLKGSNEKSFHEHLVINWEYSVLNWTVLNMDYSADYIFNWMAEFGIDDTAVIDKILEVFQSCPIKITESDNFNSIEKKLNGHLISLVNQR